jgi:hypothetical protein
MLARKLKKAGVFVQNRPNASYGHDPAAVGANKSLIVRII